MMMMASGPDTANSSAASAESSAPVVAPRRHDYLCSSSSPWELTQPESTAIAALKAKAASSPSHSAAIFTDETFAADASALDGRKLPGFGAPSGDEAAARPLAPPCCRCVPATPAKLCTVQKDGKNQGRGKCVSHYCTYVV